MSHNEESRLARLRSLGILDTPSERRFDRITRLASELFDTPIALVSLVDAERQWFKSRVGLDATETPRSWAFCTHAIEEGPNSVLVVENATLDSRFSANPLVVGDPKIRFYAGATLTTAEGDNLGTLCVIDQKPRLRPSEAQLESLRELASLAVGEMELTRKLQLADQRLDLLRLSEAMSGVGFWRFDVVTSHVTWSEHVYAIYGVDPATFDPNLQSVIESYHPDDRPILEGYIKRAVETGEGYSFELRITRADGDLRRVMAKAIAELDSAGRVVAITGVFQDVTEYVRAREVIAESEARYRMIADNTTDVIGRISIDGVIRYVSPAIKRLTGHTVEEVLGRKTFALTHPEDVGSVVAAFRNLMAGRPNERPIRYRIHHKETGDWIWVEANPRLVVGDDGEPEFIDVLRDIRGQMAIEQSMLRAKVEAEAGARAKSDFLANMSHEIRTPLNGIVGYAALLAASPDLPAKYRRHANIIAESSNGLIRIVDDVLDFSALDAGEIGFEMRPFDIRALLRTSTEVLQVQAAEKLLDLATEVDGRVADRFLGDDARIRQALINLIGNAIKFTETGRVELRCEPVADGSRQTLRFSVRDTGIGIPKDKIDELFTRFNQADSTISRRYGGTGLGLAITKRIILGMGGNIGVGSEKGRGSTFWFTLPLAATEEPANKQTKSLRLGEAARLQRRRILLVDDHDINRELGAVLLTPLGHEVVLATDGREAVELVERESFDLVFMDVQMPVMDGLAATRVIRSLPVGKNLPIVALTAHAMRNHVEECLGAGMTGHVAKPFTAQILQNAISMWARTDAYPALLPDVANDLPFSSELLALQRRFVDRSANDANEIRSFLTEPTKEREARVRTIVHRLAGTAGSLGFQDAGGIALAIDASTSAGYSMKADELEVLWSLLNGLQPPLENPRRIEN